MLVLSSKYRTWYRCLLFSILCGTGSFFVWIGDDIPRLLFENPRVIYIYTSFYVVRQAYQSSGGVVSKKIPDDNGMKMSRSAAIAPPIFLERIRRF